MESPQGSWQFENFSSAKEFARPSISPPPSSPTLYSIDNNINLSNNNYLDFSSFTNTTNINHVPTNSNDLFFNPLNQNNVIGGSSIQQQQQVSFGSQNFGGFTTPVIGQQQQQQIMNMNELLITQDQQQQQMINYDDILDLADLAWTAAEKSLHLDSQVGQFQVNNNWTATSTDATAPKTFIWSAANSVVNQPHNVTSPVSSVAEEEEELDTKFKSILEELGFPSGTQIEDIQGVSTFISAPNGQLVSTASLTSSYSASISSSVDSSDEEMYSESDSPYSSGGETPGSLTPGFQYMSPQHQHHYDSVSIMSGSTSSSNSSIIFGSGSTSISSSQPSSVSSSLISDDEESEAITVDDLLITAAAAAPPLSFPAVEAIRPAVTIGPAQEEVKIEETKQAEPKQERRGRKPASDRTPWSHLKDKGLRKKEQNKTAATRYRQKKKLETMEFLEQEKVLLAENDKLNLKRKDLLKETNILKGVLRALFANKKKNQLKRNNNNKPSFY